MIFIGIVGSRKRVEYIRVHNMVRNAINKYGDITIVSGGAKGIDTTALIVANELGIPIIEYKPKLDEYSNKYDNDNNLIFKGKGNDIYFERNELIAKKSDYLYAFPLGRYMVGGTMNTVGQFIELKGKDNLTIID